MLVIKNNTWKFDVNLTFDSVPNVFKLCRKEFDQLQDNWIIDFSSCSKIDSSGLALIIECIKFSKQNNIELSLKGLRQEVRFLAKVHGMEDILIAFIN